MHDLSGVGVTQGFEDLADVADTLVDRDGRLADALVERDSLDQLHHHHELIIDSQRGVQGSDMGMIEAGVDLDLTHEALGQLGLVGEVGKEDFGGFDAVRDQIADLVYLAHAAGPEEIDDLVIADGVTDFKGHTAHFALVHGGKTAPLLSRLRNMVRRLQQ